jgi:hypothetical protein
VIPPLGQAHGLQSLKRALPPFRAFQASIDKWQFNILDGIGAGQKIVSLEDESQVVATQTGPLLLAERPNIEATEEIRATGGRVKAAEDIHGG